jgi:flagellin-like hook-associated protein FlgL
MAVSLSAGVRQALSSLSSTQAEARVAQSRLATGKKVNSALDNPTSFFTASGLNNRANDLSKLLDNMGQAIKTLQAADKGIKAITKLVENAQSLANQARATTEGKAAAGAVSAVAMVKTGSAGPTDTAIDNATTVDFTVDGTTTSVDVSAATNKATLVDAINNANLGITAAVSGSDISLTHDTAGLTGRSITVGGASAAALFGTLDDTTAGVDAAAAQAAVTPDASRSKLATDFATIRTQIDQLVKDSGYNGVNLLNGDTLSVTFNEKGSSKLDIAGKTSDTSSGGLNVRAAANSWASNTDVQAALDDLKAATDTLRASASSFGASLSIVQNRQDFTQSMIETLNNGADELTVADSNQEGANLLALNTRSQLSQTALSLASQQDQAVLRLF